MTRLRAYWPSHSLGITKHNTNTQANPTTHTHPTLENTYESNFAAPFTFDMGVSPGSVLLTQPDTFP